MTELYIKDIKLSIPKPIWLFSLLSMLVVIPQYPIIVGVLYFFMAVMTYFQISRETKDLEFCAVLPISRKHIVASKTFVVITFQAAQMLIAIVAAIISANVIQPQGNTVGIDPNPTFFAIVLGGFGVFNIVFLPWFFKSTKYGFPTLFATIAFVLFYVVCETAIQLIPAITPILDSLNPQYLGIQFATTAAGLALFALLTFLAYRLSVKNFDKVDL